MEPLCDDIPDPVTPAAVLASGPLVPETYDLRQLKDLCLVHVRESMEALTDDARLLLARLAAPPVYNDQATITVRSPDGFLVAISTAHTTSEEMIHAVCGIITWCKGNGYTPA
jgi:hypothetical protein